MTVDRKKIIRQWIRIVLGLLVFSLGVHLTIKANIGLAPWDCLGMGVANHTPLNYGLAMTIMSVIILGIDLLLKERIGYGTVIDALLTGNFVQLFNDVDTLPENKSMILGIGIMLAGFVFMALGMWIYMRGEQCCGPRDSLLVGLGKRLPKGYCKDAAGAGRRDPSSGGCICLQTNIQWLICTKDEKSHFKRAFLILSI